jgi:agmatinase
MPFDPGAAAAPDSGIFGLPHSETDARLILVPVPFEATTSYRAGTARGPEAILEASRQVDLWDAETGRPYQAGIHLLPIPDLVRALDRNARRDAQRVMAAGGSGPPESPLSPGLVAALERVNRAGERLNAWVEEQVSRLLRAGKRVGVIGGDHSVALGSIAAHARQHAGMGVLHVDAHADLRPAFGGFTYSHASVLYNVAEHLPQVSRIVQVALRDLSELEASYAAASGGRIQQFGDQALAQARFQGETWSAQVKRIVRRLPSEVYLTVDIDGLEPALCPHTGTPVPGGLSFQQLCGLLAGLVESGRRIVGLDLVEVAPGEGTDQWDANVGARVLYKMIGWMLASERNPKSRTKPPLSGSAGRRPAPRRLG